MSLTIIVNDIQYSVRSQREWMFLAKKMAKKSIRSLIEEFSDSDDTEKRKNKEENNESEEYLVGNDEDEENNLSIEYLEEDNDDRDWTFEEEYSAGNIESEDVSVDSNGAEFVLKENVDERVVCPECFNTYLNVHSLQSHIRVNHGSGVHKVVKRTY